MARAVMAWLLILMVAVTVALAHFLGLVRVPGLPDFEPAPTTVPVAPVWPTPITLPTTTAPPAPGTTGAALPSPTPSAAPPSAVLPPAAGQAAPRDPAWAEVVPGAQRHPRLGLPDQVVDKRTRVEMVLIEEGEYARGIDPVGRSNVPQDATPAHTVVITRPFYLGVSEVTQGQFRRVMGTQHRSEHNLGDDYPVELVSFGNVSEFLKRTGFRLPTEAEWEFACRAGRQDPIFGYSEDPSAPSLANMGDFAWFAGNSGDGTHTVGRKKPNGNRVFDMLGNVSEWTSSWYYKADYAEAAPRAVDPKGPQYGEEKVIRGCNFHSDVRICSCSLRFRGNASDFRNFFGSGGNLGIRVARDAD